MITFSVILTTLTTMGLFRLYQYREQQRRAMAIAVVRIDDRRRRPR